MPTRTEAVTIVGLNYPPEPTGISPYTGAMARGLSQRAYRVRVLTAHPHYPEWQIRAGYGQWTRNEVHDGVQVRRLRHYVPQRPSPVRRFLSEVSFGVRSVFTRWNGPHVVVAVSPALFASALAAFRVKTFHRRTPLVVWVQDLYWLGLSETDQGRGRARAIIKATERWLLRMADCVVVIHDRFAQRVVEDFGLDADRVLVVRNWTHLRPVPDIDRPATRAKFGWGEETVVLHAGNMGIKQGLDNVLDAARIAAEKSSHIRFVLLGNGVEKPRLADAGANIPTLQFIDSLSDDDFAAALRAADILLVNEKAGVSEMAVPSKLTSYFSTGRPVLAATDVGGITADEVRASKGGIVVRAGDPEQLLDAAIALGGDTDLSARLGANGLTYRKTVLDETFAIDQFASL
ncbi:MAG TPA: glycosyltransferase WbuB, partial [Gemmatimonadetes bacterium]|nr:glycosyltransferase WbuB [Gemmatimonadota bacterium]